MYKEEFNKTIKYLENHWRTAIVGTLEKNYNGDIININYKLGDGEYSITLSKINKYNLSCFNLENIKIFFGKDNKSFIGYDVLYTATIFTGFDEFTHSRKPLFEDIEIDEDSFNNFKKLMSLYNDSLMSLLEEERNVKKQIEQNNYIKYLRTIKNET